MKEKQKRSQHTPIAWRTYLDGCGLISFIFVSFWGILIVGMVVAFNIAFHYGIESCAGSALVMAIIGELVRQDRLKHKLPVG
jgi:hypothetical protein